MSAHFTLNEAARVTGGTILGSADGEFCGLSIDSRQLRAGEAFLAICGDRFDGHGFVDAAVRAGAALLVLSQRPEVLPETPVLMVGDTKRALAALASAWRNRVAPRVLGVTGSVGKTTTKELCRAILATAGPTHATPGNFNNEIGLPLTLLGMPEETRFLVAEMGMSAPGEIARLTALARPDAGLITRVAAAHLLGLGSIERVAAAKAELLEGLAGGAWAVVPGDEPLLAPWAERHPRERLLRFGAGAGDDVRLVRRRPLGESGAEVTLSVLGKALTVHLPLPGEHNARNAAAAAAAATALGLPAEAIAQGLSQVPELGHRSRVLSLCGLRVLDDCYNANPTAVEAGLLAVVELAAGGPAAAVLGAMLELGPDEERLHRDLGVRAAGMGLALLVTVGPLGRCIAEGALEAGMPRERVRAVDAPEEAARALREKAPPGAWVLVKASRGARLERVLAHL